MKNLVMVKKNGRGSFEEGEKWGSNAHWEGGQSEPQAANQPSFLRGGAPSYSSVNYEPLPSFLTQTPLGTPHEETIGLSSGVFKPREEFSVVRQQEATVSRVSLSSGKAVEQTRQLPEKPKRKMEQSKKIVKPYKGGQENRFIHRLVYGEVRLSMSKMSIMSLVLGLLFLGALFFIIGFLAAVSTLKPDEEIRHSQSAWQASNTDPQQGDAKSQKSGKLGRIAGAVAGGLLGQELHKQFAPLGKIVGAASSVVPRPLQPFARYGAGSARAEVRSVERQVNPFYPERRGQQSYYGGQPQSSGVPQQYPASQYQQGQPYPAPSFPGYQGYGAMPPQQPMMPQQPIGVPQQVMQPSPYPQYPQQYPQQMAPQQGYYR